LVVAAISMCLSGCSRSNMLLLGWVEGQVGTHRVEVTDCYRLQVPPPLQTEEEGKAVYYFTPCRDADVIIRDDHLSVNGKFYGRLEPDDPIIVDHGHVLVNGIDASEVFP
jgi:hypothetical protein